MPHWPNPAMIRPAFVLWTMLISLFMASLFAPGTMPGRGANGGFVIELCTPEGIQHITLGPDGKPTPAGEQASMGDCAFAAAQVLAADAGPVWTLPLTGQASSATVLPSQIAWGTDPRAKYTHAQGPPAFL
jgi:hypothetical protein